MFDWLSQRWSSVPCVSSCFFPVVTPFSQTRATLGSSCICREFDQSFQYATPETRKPPVARNSPPHPMILPQWIRFCISSNVVDSSASLICAIGIFATPPIASYMKSSEWFGRCHLSEPCLALKRQTIQPFQIVLPNADLRKKRLS